MIFLELLRNKNYLLILLSQIRKINNWSIFLSALYGVGKRAEKSTKVPIC